MDLSSLSLEYADFEFVSFDAGDMPISHGVLLKFKLIYSPFIYK